MNASNTNPEKEKSLEVLNGLLGRVYTNLDSFSSNRYAPQWN